MKRDLFHSVKIGHLEDLRKLITEGEDINQRDESGVPLLIQSLTNFYIKQDMVMLLIEFGADVNIKCDKGNTPLKLAVRYNLFEVAKKLLTQNANPDIKNIEGDTPLMQALCNRNEELVKLLVHHNANVNILDKNGNTPLFNLLSEYSVHYDMVMLLIELKANVNFKSNLGVPILNIAVRQDYIEITRKLVEAKANTNYKNKSSESPLDLALKNRNEDIVRLLVDNKANLNHIDKDGNSLLMNQLSEWTVHFDMVMLLIELGVNVNLSNNFGLTPLFKATNKGLIGITKALLENNANPDFKHPENKSCLGQAVNDNNYPLVELLINAGANFKGVESKNPEIMKLLASSLINHVDAIGITELSGLSSEEI